MTRCEIRRGSLISIEGPTLQQPSVAQEIRRDSRMGILKLVVVHGYVFRSFHRPHNWRRILRKPSTTKPICAYSHLYVGLLSSLDFGPHWVHRAYSIRIAASLDGRIETVNARGWEGIPGTIAEIETQHLTTTTLVWVNVVELQLSW